MLKFYISIQIDDNFGSTKSTPWGPIQSSIPNGILNINGYFAMVDPSLFKSKDFFKPVEAILKNNVKLDNMTFDEIESILGQFGRYTIDDKQLLFDNDNFYDLDKIFINDEVENRISIQYKNCPVNSFYLLPEGDCVKIIISPFTKDYYSIEEYQWYKFINYLNEEIGTSELRELKLNQILGDKPNKSINLIRQLRFFLKKSSNSFLESVLSFYDKNGRITDKQYDAVAKIIW